MRTFTRGAAIAASGAMALILAACGSSSGSNGNDVVVDNADEIGSACAVVGEDVTVNLCEEGYVQPSATVTANGLVPELYNSPAGGDPVNCYQDFCDPEVQAGDEFTAVCEQDDYIGVVLKPHFRVEYEYYVAEMLYWTSGTTADNDRFVAIVFIPSSGLESADEVVDNLTAEFESTFGDGYNVRGSCRDPRAAIDSDEINEYLADQDAA